jgi:hypothetical protein
MVESVAANVMTFRRNSLYDVFPARDILSQQEERRLHLLFCQHVEQSRGQPASRPIIQGQNDAPVMDALPV